MTLERPLALHAGDGRPESALGLRFFDVAAIAGGLTSIVLIVATAAFLILLTTIVQRLTDALDPEEEVVQPILEEEDIVEARFVVLGRDFQDELPNRIVPRLSTAPPPPAEVPTEATPDTPPDQVERPQEAPPDAVNDAILRIGDRAQAFAEIAEEREREGSPEGIEEGTEQEGTEGDVYRGRLYAFFRRGWSIPTTLNREETDALSVSVDIQIGQDLEIVSFSIRGAGSGNPLFDESVTQQLTRLQASDQRIPPPPEEVADQYIGRAIAVRFHGRQAG
jgi:hypothetical protein